ncbi:MAG: MBL fold metallo-hydrolase [Halodesulfurarchaeum sp.]
MSKSVVENLASGVDAFTSNVFLVRGERPVLVDAGSNFDVISAVSGRNVEPDAIILTHTHPDHVGNVSAVTAEFGAETWGFDPDREPVDNPISPGSTIQMGEDEYTALHTPGHAEDHLCFYSESSKRLFAGDLVFPDGGFGRTDLPGGDRTTLIESIERIAEHVDEDLRELHCGHGRSITDEPYSHVRAALQMARGR